MAPEPSTETAGTSFDPPQAAHAPSGWRRPAGETFHEGCDGGGGVLLSAPTRCPFALVAVPVGEGSGEDTADGGRLRGGQRRPSFPEIHVTLSDKAYWLLKAARADNPGTTYCDLIASTLVRARPTLLAERPAPPDDPLLRPARTQRLHVEGRTRSRPVNVTPAQADAIRALADEVGIPNLSELVDRSVVLTYDSAIGASGAR